MNWVMTQRWNERVAPEDTIYNLDDFAMGEQDLKTRRHGHISIATNANKHVTSLSLILHEVLCAGYCSALSNA